MSALFKYMVSLALGAGDQPLGDDRRARRPEGRSRHRERQTPARGDSSQCGQRRQRDRCGRNRPCRRPGTPAWLRPARREATTASRACRPADTRMRPQGPIQTKTLRGKVSCRQARRGRPVHARRGGRGRRGAAGLRDRDRSRARRGSRDRRGCAVLAFGSWPKSRVSGSAPKQRFAIVLPFGRPCRFS
jgi:hypothetical protein